MGNQEDEEFYCNLSRKELQGLCKKYGLSANKTKFQLVQSLVSYLQSNQKNINSATSEERCNGFMGAFLPTSSVRKLESVGEICKGTHDRGVQTSDADILGPSHFSKEESSEHLHSQTVKSNGLCGHTHMSPKASGATLNMVLNKPSINGAKEGYDQQEITIISRFDSKCDVGRFNPERFESQRAAEARNSDKNSWDSTTDGGAGNSSQIQYRNTTSGVFSKVNELLPSTETSIKAPPSFEFYVSSEEGINLYVDLNSNPSDCVEGLKNDVCIFQKLHHNESRVLRQELKSLGVGDEEMTISSPWNKESGFQTKGEPGCSRFSQCSAVINDHSSRVPYHPDIADESLRSSTTIPFKNPLEISGVSEDDDPVLSSLSRPHSDVQIQMISGTKTCPGEGEMVCLDLEVPDASQIKLTSNSLLNSKSDGPNCPDSLKHQNSVFSSTSTENSERHSTGTCNVFSDTGYPVSTKICKVLVPFNTVSFENPSEVCPGFSTSVSMEMLSEVGSQCKSMMNSPYQNCSLLNFDDPMNSAQTENRESANCEHDQYNCRYPPTESNEAWERSSTISDTESSECSQIDNSLERTRKRLHGFEYLDDLQSKRLHTNGVDQNGCTKPAGKNLKSMMHTAREALSSRRSLRLVSK